MKYSEFLQLNEAMETKGTTLRKELGLEKLNELGQEAATLATEKAKEKKAKAAPAEPAADVPAPESSTPDQVETEKGGLFTKWGRIKSSLNKNAKKLQQQVIKQVSKYLPNVLKTERIVTETLVKAIQENKKGDQLTNIYKQKAKTVTALQEKQLKAMYDLVDKLLNNADATYNKKIDGAESSKTLTGALDATAAFFKGGKDTATLQLKNYWQTLHTQIQMNVYNYITKTIENDTRTVLKDYPDAYKIWDELSPTGKAADAKEAEAAALAKEKTDKLKAEEAAAKEAAAKGSTDVKPEVGKKYTYKNTEGKDEEITIKEVKEDGKILATKTSDGTDYTFTKDNFGLEGLKPVEETKPTRDQKTDVAGGPVEAPADKQ